jgi:hypothetical protein
MHPPIHNHLTQSLGLRETKGSLSGLKKYTAPTITNGKNCMCGLPINTAPCIHNKGDNAINGSNNAQNHQATSWP